MSLISIPFTFTVGAVIVASQHNSNFSIIYSDYNGNITDENIASNASISDSKLGQITTAGKVSGASLSSLSSIPSGAGTIPLVNLPGTFSSAIVLGIHNTSTQSIASSNTWTKKTFTTIDKDSGSYWSGNTYTPLVAGWYFVSYTDGFNISLANALYNIAIYKNGSLYSGFSSSDSVAANQHSGTATGLIQMNGSTDYIEFFVMYISASSPQPTLGSGYSFATIFRVI